MEITVLDFFMVNILSYIGGLATGLLICCKHKDKLLVKSRSLENISTISAISNTSNNHPPSQTPYSTPPIMASAPPPEAKQPIKITLE